MFRKNATKVEKFTAIIVYRDRHMERHDVKADSAGGFTLGETRFSVEPSKMFRIGDRWGAIYRENNVNPIDPFTGKPSEMTPAEFHDAVEQTISRKIIRDVEDTGRDISPYIIMAVPVIATVGAAYYLYEQIQSLAAQNAELMARIAEVSSNGG